MGRLLTRGRTGFTGSEGGVRYGTSETRSGAEQAAQASRVSPHGSMKTNGFLMQLRGVIKPGQIIFLCLN